MILEVVEQVEELVVVGAVAGLAGELVHVGGPARGADGGYIEGVDLFDAVLPLLWWCVDEVRLGVGTNLGLDTFLLLKKHTALLKVPHTIQHGALHDGAPFVILDIPHPHAPIQRDLLGKALLLEVPNGVVVSIREEVHDVAGGLDVVLEVGHHVGAVTLDLLIGADSAKDNLGEAAALEGAVGDAADDLERLLDDGNGEMGPVVDEAGDVVLGHLGELLLEDAFEAGEDDEGLALVVVVDHPELDFALALLEDGRLVGEWDWLHGLPVRGFGG